MTWVGGRGFVKCWRVSKGFLEFRSVGEEVMRAANVWTERGREGKEEVWV